MRHRKTDFLVTINHCFGFNFHLICFLLRIFLVKYIVRKLDYGYLIGIKKKILYPDQFLTLKRSVNKRGLNFKNKFKIFVLRSKFNRYKNINKFFNLKRIKENYINSIPDLKLKKYKLNVKIGNLKKHRNFIFAINIFRWSNDNFFAKTFDSQKFLYDSFVLYFDSKLYLYENLKKLIIKRFNKKFRRKFKFVRKNLKFNLKKKMNFINFYKIKNKKISVKIKSKDKKKNKNQINTKKKYIYINYIIKYIKNLLLKKSIKHKKDRRKSKFSRKIIKYLIEFNISKIKKNSFFFNYFNFIEYNRKKFNHYLKGYNKLAYFKYKRNSKISFIKITYNLWKIRSIKLNFYGAKLIISINKYLKEPKENLNVNNLTYPNITKLLALKKNKLWHKFFLNFLYIFFFKYYNFKIISNRKKIVKKQYKLNLNFFNLERYNYSRTQKVHLFESQNSFFFFRFLRMSKKLLDLFKPVRDLFCRNTNKFEIKQKILYYNILNFYFKNIKCINNYSNLHILDICMNTNIFNIATEKIIYIKFLNFLLYMAALKQNLYFKNTLKC